ncbi:hypothetical protein M422DRAFT_244728 [Sphaerobolus stellatus SS14]|nr:hypothetical protein M422DRAFT_244728 [Sphaerobolus stellatus SS14]
MRFTSGNPYLGCLRHFRWVVRKAEPFAYNMVMQTETKPEMLSRNPITGREWHEDPLNKPQGTIRNLVDLLDDGEELERAGYKNWPKDLPLLILHGDSDQARRVIFLFGVC